MNGDELRQLIADLQRSHADEAITELVVAVVRVSVELGRKLQRVEALEHALRETHRIEGDD